MRSLIPNPKSEEGNRNKGVEVDGQNKVDAPKVNPAMHAIAKQGDPWQSARLQIKDAKRIEES